MLRAIPWIGSAFTDQKLQRYLAHENQPPPRILQKDYAWGHKVVLGGGAVLYERGCKWCLRVGGGEQGPNPGFRYRISVIGGLCGRVSAGTPRIVSAITNQRSSDAWPLTSGEGTT